MITRDTILELLEKAENPALSIYLHTHEKGEEVQQDPIRFKNQLTEAERKLEERNMPARKIDEMLKPARKLLDRPPFWRYGDRGLALFISGDYFQTFKVPLDFREEVQVGRSFLITPLLPMITLEGTFCILALSQKKMRLLRATRESSHELAFEKAPKSMEEFKQYDLEEKSLSSYSGDRGRTMFHGWGDDSVESDYVENYLKQVENEVTSILRKRNDPLILAGVNEAVALYRKVNHYHRLMEQALTANPDPKSEAELRDEAWEVIRSYFLENMYSDLERYNDLKGTGKQSDNLSRIVESSHYGKVDTLFVCKGEQSWGWFDRDREVVHHGTENGSGGYDLINEAAIRTLSQGGDVYALEREDMPDGVTVAAIYRYG